MFVIYYTAVCPFRYIIIYVSRCSSLQIYVHGNSGNNLVSYIWNEAASVTINHDIQADIFLFDDPITLLAFPWPLGRHYKRVIQANSKALINYTNTK